MMPNSSDDELFYGVAILALEPDGSVKPVAVSPDFLLLTGQKRKNLIGLDIDRSPVWQDNHQLWTAINKCLDSHQTQQIKWLFNKDDTPTAVYCQVIPTFSEDEKLTKITLVISDHSSDENMARDCQKNEYHDQLTGLPNKNYLNNFFESKILQDHPHGEVAILLINILQFQRINESFGYEFGDGIILNIAAKIEACLPKGALLSRFGGDKFAIVILDQDYGAILEEAENLAKTIHHEVKKPIQADDHNIHLSLSIGISIGAISAKDCTKLIQQSHIAMQRLNNRSRERTLVYRPELQIRANSRLKMESELREALKNKGLSLYFQPIINLQNGGLLGFEALCRWVHPTMGMISPIDFIPLAEESGLIVPLGNWVLREACDSLNKWINSNPTCSNLVINVNVSGLQLLQDDFVAITRDALLKASLKGHHLKLEITETTLIENAEIVRDILLDLKSLDISLAIDDFGTGYSSLSYLNRFPADTLKIDKSFINRMTANEDNYKIIHIISTLAQTLGMNVVAEGIETEEQVPALKKLGCQAGQGYLFSRPLSFAEASEYIRKETTPLV